MIWSTRSIRGYKTMMKADPDGTLERVDRIIRNTYRTLMTRGMKGCFVYCTDAETRVHLRDTLAGSRQHQAHSHRRRTK